MSRLLSDLKDLKERFKELNSKFSDFEAYQLALGLQRNELIQEAFMVRMTEGSNFAPYIPNAMERVVQELEESNEYLNEIRVGIKEIKE